MKYEEQERKIYAKFDDETIRVIKHIMIKLLMKQ